MGFVDALAYRLVRLTTALWRPMAGRRVLPQWAVVRHRGRRSGRDLSTPVQVRTYGEFFVIAVLFPERSQWVRNVQAAGGCTLRWHGEDHQTDAPELIGATEAALAYNVVERLLIRLFRFRVFLRLRRVAVAAG